MDGFDCQSYLDSCQILVDVMGTHQAVVKIGNVTSFRIFFIPEKSDYLRRSLIGIHGLFGNIRQKLLAQKTAFTRTPNFLKIRSDRGVRGKSLFDFISALPGYSTLIKYFSSQVGRVRPVFTAG